MAARRLSKNHVIANQSADWCGNPLLPWLPLWGSCHEVTERVNTRPLRPVRGTSPIGKRQGPHPSRACGGRASHLPRRGRLWKRIATPVCGLVRNDSSSIWALCLFETAPFSLEIRVKSGRPMAAPTCSFVDSQKIVCDLIRLFEPPSPLRGRLWGYGL